MLEGQTLQNPPYPVHVYLLRPRRVTVPLQVNCSGFLQKKNKKKIQMRTANMPLSQNQYIRVIHSHDEMSCDYNIYFSLTIQITFSLRLNNVNHILGSPKMIKKMIRLYTCPYLFY